MPVIRADRAGNSGAEEKFIQLFCDVFGPEKGQYTQLLQKMCRAVCWKIDTRRLRHEHAVLV